MTDDRERMISDLAKEMSELRPGPEPSDTRADVAIDQRLHMPTEEAEDAPSAYGGLNWANY